MPNEISLSKKYTTRDGQAVRLLCVDGPGGFPVVGIVGPDVHYWRLTGIYSITPCPLDLIESPREIRVKGWVNIWDATPPAIFIHPTRDAALVSALGKPSRFACAEINLTVKEGEGITK